MLMQESGAAVGLGRSLCHDFGDDCLDCPEPTPSRPYVRICFEVLPAFQFTVSEEVCP